MAASATQQLGEAPDAPDAPRPPEARPPEPPRRGSHPRLPMALPDCSTREATWSLSPEQREAVVRILAQKGPAGLEAWLREEERRDPRLRQRLKEHLERLQREARAERSRLEERQAQERSGQRSAWERNMQEQSEREAALRKRLQDARAAGLDTARLLDLSPVLRQATAPPAPGLWRKLQGFFLAFWLAFVRLWVRLLRFLTGRKAASRTVRAGGHDVDLLRLARDHPELFARLRIRPDASMGDRLRAAWDRMLGREDYAETVQRMMDQALADAKGAAELAARADAEALERSLDDLARQSSRQSEARRKEEAELEAAQRRERDQLEARVSGEPFSVLRDEVVRDFAEAGLVDNQGRATHLLVERFASLLAADELGNLPAGGAATPGSYAGGDGEYERGPLLSHHELGAMDLAESVVQARVHHPRIHQLFDDDAIVHREVRSTSAHVVVILDTSGSMEEAGRLEAAKRVALVLHRAVRLRRDDARIDLLQMETGVHRVDLAACWNAEPRGFTNFAAALRDARRLLEAEGADRQIVYMITDGLPEALTLADGTDKADNPSVCLPPALDEAKRLRRSGAVHLVIYQLTQEARYVEAAQRIAKAAGGRVEALDPQQLMRSLVVDFQQAIPM